MSLLERGRTDPKLSTIARVAGGLGLSVSALLAEVEREAATATPEPPGDEPSSDEPSGGERPAAPRETRGGRPRPR